MYYFKLSIYLVNSKRGTATEVLLKINSINQMPRSSCVTPSICVFYSGIGRNSYKTLTVVLVCNTKQQTNRKLSWTCNRAHTWTNLTVLLSRVALFIIETLLATFHLVRVWEHFFDVKTLITVLFINATSPAVFEVEGDTALIGCSTFFTICSIVWICNWVLLKHRNLEKLPL